MDKLSMQTANTADDNFKKLAAMFPNAVTETINENGEVVRAIDKDVLMQEISCKVVDGNEERYQFTWPDKKKSVLLANAPINKTLRPCREESVDFDTTENLYIEGDNLEVLKLLQETYLGKIKMIYIDPPYNTGNDFVYEDDFAQSTEEYLANSGQYDEDGNRMVQNTESNGRFHTDWLNMVYPRLKLAKDLLSDNGAIFISIDDNELNNILSVCNEIFGEANFVGCITWFKKASPSNDAQFFSNDCEYVLVYAKDKTIWRPHRLPLSKEQITKYYQNPDNDPRGPWNSATYTCNKSRSERPKLYYPITNPFTGEQVYPKETAVWAYSEQQCQEHIKNNMLFWGANGNAKFPRFKKFITDNKGVVTRTLWHYDDVNHTQGATLELSKLGLPYFPTPKPTKLIEKMLRIASEKDAIILDFFSGSATTAHAVMQLNAEDGGHRKFIMVQLPEKCDEKSEAYKAGYKTICEIGKERIRRAGKKIREENADNSSLLTPNSKLDTGFRVLKCDTSNMKDVYYNPAEYEVNMFSRLEDNIKEDRTPEDLLFQVMLDLGVLLSSKIEETTIAGKKVFNVEDNYLIACFDSDVSEETIKAIAKQKPYYFVMRDSSMASDSVATNFDQIFATYSPDTVRKVL
ncbi:site-specific DNA-methyltransferase [Subdoligranulum variabile]|uniref:site-specific DNA-methyltransferase n=1 Tax=Subdoligranulum variabile TaxID=214851 RepID=UPI0026EE0461|nr:site-specific DNA-methyltransferase [Subdoligranulum variabile]